MATGPRRDARATVQHRYPGAGTFVPERRSIKAMTSAVQHCRGCPLFQRATQAVFGEGPIHARLMLVGEQPGNDEDLAGHPFVGPAGRLLNDALAEAGIARAEAYVTNAVKHFKWEEAGTRRLHKKPDSHEVSACMPWLGAELESVRPKVVVALGATAAQALLGRAFRVSRQHGVPVSVPFANHAIATLHPSAVLRQRSATARAKERASLVADLRVARALLETSGD